MNKFRTMLIKFFGYLLIASLLAFISYFIVYEVSFLPNGYEIEAVEKDKVSLKSFDLLGSEKDKITKTFSEDETWKIEDIQGEVKRQKSSLWMLFSFTAISLFLFVYKIRNGLKLWKAIFESNIIFAVLMPLYILVTTLNRLQTLLS